MLSHPLTATSDLVELYPKYKLYLKPIARVNITVQIPGLNNPIGASKSISNWEVIEKLRQLAPDLLSPPTQIKVLKNTLEFVRFVAELESKKDVKRVVMSLDSHVIKLNGSPHSLRVRACEAKLDFPRKHDWDSFFRDAVDMDETKPGERPDTIIISGLPVRWFSDQIIHNEDFVSTSLKVSSTGNRTDGESSSSNLRALFMAFNPDFVKNWPCERILIEVFSTLGQVRRVDIPSLDIVQNEKLIHIVEAAISKLYPSCIVPHLADAVETCPASSSISAADTIVSSVDVSSSAGLVSSSSTNTLCNIQTPFTSAVQPNNITTPSGVTFGKPGPSSLAELLRAIERAKRSVSSSAKAANQLLTSKDVAPSSTSTMNPTATTAFSTLTASASDSPINESFVAVLGLTFDAYVQFMDYTAFARAMQALGGMKLVYAPRMREADTGSESEATSSTGPAVARAYYTAECRLDFDRTRHLTAASCAERTSLRRQLEHRLLRAHRKRLAALAAAEAERLRQASLAEAKMRADAAQRQAKRMAREAKRKEKLEQHRQRERDALLQQKAVLEARLNLILTRRKESTRLLEVLISRAQARHCILLKGIQAYKEAKSEAKKHKRQLEKQRARQRRSELKLPLDNHQITCKIMHPGIGASCLPAGQELAITKNLSTNRRPDVKTLQIQTSLSLLHTNLLSPEDPFLNLDESGIRPFFDRGKSSLDAYTPDSPKQGFTELSSQRASDLEHDDFEEDNEEKESRLRRQILLRREERLRLRLIERKLALCGSNKS